MARYRFGKPAQPWLDETGAHDGATYSGMPGTVAGPVGCGDALGVGPGLAGVVEDAPAFDLALGSIDFWVRAPATDETIPLLSRDASEAESEHLTFFLSGVETEQGTAAWGHLVVRHQSMSTAAALCSEDALPVDDWVHVAYNFGPPHMELYIDGVLQESDDTPVVPGGGIPACDGITNDPEVAGDPVPFVGGMQTSLPWFIAATAQGSNKVPPEPSAHMGGGALDEIRISAVRRNFAAL